MTFYLKEMKWLLVYSLFSFILTVIVVWLNKEIFWIGLLVFIDWINYPIIVTSLFEGLFTYLRLSLFLGFIISSVSILIMWLLFFRPGLYQNEYNKVNKGIYWIICMNILLFPLLSKFMGYWLITDELWFIGKMNELLDGVINLFILLQIILILPMLLFNNVIVKFYIKNRVYIIMLFYFILSMLTPPDLWISISLLTIIVGVVESVVLIKYIIN